MAACRYIKIATKIWRDEKFSRLSKEGKLLYMYILTSHHSNMAGYYVLPELYIMEDLKWKRKTLEKGLKELFQKGLVNQCSESHVVLVPKYFKYNLVENSNQAKGVNRRVLELPANSLVDGFKIACKTYCARYYETLIKGLPRGLPGEFIKGLAEPLGEGQGEGYGKPETEAEAKTVTEAEAEKKAGADPGSTKLGQKIKGKSEAEKETAAENFPAASPEELKTLNVLRGVKRYPFEFEKDLELLRELKSDFSRINLLEEAKKWKVYKLDKPLNENTNARYQLRKWVAQAEEWRDKSRDCQYEDRDGYRNELILSDRQKKLGGLIGEKC